MLSTADELWSPEASRSGASMTRTLVPTLIPRLSTRPRTGEIVCVDVDGPDTDAAAFCAGVASPDAARPAVSDRATRRLPTDLLSRRARGPLTLARKPDRSAATRLEATESQNQRTIARLMDTLELLAGHAEPLRLTDVASELKLPVSSTHVLLQSLVEREYVCVSDEERRYGVDRGLIALALRVLDRLTIIETAKPVMAALAARTREDVYLGAPIGREIVYVAKVEGALSPRLGIQLASDRPLHATSVGKLYLAMLPDDELERRLAEIELVRFTPHTITNPTVLRAELTAIRHEGCAVTDGEHLEGIAAAAAAIVDASGAFVGALSLSVSRSRFHENAPNLLADLVDAAAQVSADLAAHNPTATVAEPRRELADSTS